MKYYNFNYVEKFSCIGSNCKHNCCIGWKIHIDQKTLKKYIELQKTDAHFNSDLFIGKTFNLDKKGRCPFLEQDNLCYIIKNYGEKNLCKTCKTHPRFKNFFLDRIETGLGLYCEQACKIILSQKSKMKLELVKQTKNTKALSSFERKIIKFRKDVLKVVQNRKISINERILELEKLINIKLNDFSYIDWIKFYNDLEKLSVNNFSFDKLTLFSNFTTLNENLSREFEQVLAYLNYRHISRAIDNLDLKVRLSFVLLSFKFIYQIFTFLNCGDNTNELENLIKACRIYSSEIECSDFNVITILNKIESLVKLM